MRTIGLWLGLMLASMAAFGEDPQIPVYLAIDASASMDSQWDGATKWEKCEQALKAFAKSADRALNLGVVTFGGDAASCQSVSTAVIAKRYNRGRLRMGLESKPQGQASLTELLNTLAGKASLSDAALNWVILSDGGPMCDGDFCAKLSELRQKIPQLRIHVVGVGLQPEGKDRLSCFATVTGTQAYNANRGDAILNALNEIANGLVPPEADGNGEKAPNVKASLDFTRKVNLGQKVDVQWQGPADPFAVLAVFPKKDSGGFRFFDWTPVEKGIPAALAAPDIPGTYEVRLLSGPEHRPIATKKLKVKKARASFTAPKEAKAGSELEINWQGPEGFGDRLVIYENGGDGRVAVAAAVADQSNLTLVAPSNTGEFEICYETGGTGQVLARQALTLAAPKVAVGCARQVGAGTLLKVTWQGPAAEGDLLAIAGAGNDNKRYRFLRLKETNGETEILVPDKMGTYKLQYVSGVDERVLAEQEFRTMRVNATVMGPETAPAGSDIEVKWSGPAGPGDFLGIYGNNGQNKVTLVSRLKVDNQTEVTMLAPDYPGSYRLRYVTGQSQRILAETKFKVTDVEAEVHVLRWVKVNQEFEVKFKGPGNKLDVITLLDYENPQTPTRIFYQGVGRAPVMMVKAPPKPGLYEVQYVMGKTGRVLAKAWLRVRE